MSDNTELNCTNCCVGDFMDCGFCDKEICKEYKAVGNADDFIKAVQNKVLDQIRAEIDNINLNEVATKYEDRFYGFQQEVLKILDKYKAGR